ncbi:MAG: arylsulfatase A-like enzyme [Verrucomicrobiales bacterium]|jgi:arylsulfatase A-like enzyme
MKFALTLFVVFVFSVPSTIVAEERPNVVFILSDDQAWNDYGFMGHPHIQTPTLDKLASQSLVYERGYVTAPLCRPSLASLITGLYPHQTGIRGNDPLLPEGMTKKNGGALSRQLRDRMTAPMASHPSFIRSLKENGYATLQTGKWWEGDPKKGGFTDAMTHGDPAKGGRHGDLGLKIGRETMQPYFDFVDKSIANDQPFFVWYGVFLPHSPHNAPKRFYDKYKDVAPNDPTAWYWANVEWFDETCQQLLGYLDEKGIAENTIIVYACDNGWVPNPDQRNRYTRSKREPVEAGIRTPIMVRHLGKIEPKRDLETLASTIDIAPTILRVCGIEPPKEMTGLDLREVSALAKRNRVIVETYEHDSDLDQLGDLENGLVARVVIEGWDKFISWADRGELFDLKNDPDDRNDISAAHPQRVAELVRILGAHWTEAD